MSLLPLLSCGAASHLWPLAGEVSCQLVWVISDAHLNQQRRQVGCERVKLHRLHPVTLACSSSSGISSSIACRDARRSAGAMVCYDVWACYMGGTMRSAQCRRKKALQKCTCIADVLSEG
jgi:hypothetical protein